MTPSFFTGPCEILVRDEGLRSTLQVTVEEQVAKTLYLLEHNVINRELSFIFRRSGESVSRYFYVVLRAILGLYDKFIKQPDGSHVPYEISSSQRFYPYFKDCIGAFDGTHIRVKVSQHEAPKYRGRKDYPTKNVLATCTFDLKFTYVLAGWEGTTSDSKIMKEALNSQNALKIPEGKFYLVDAGFMLRSGLITPYRRERYHLKEYSRNNPPRNSHELFNLRHSSLRNAIEHAFGVLKQRFPIISSLTESSYGIETQKLIIFACCVLHNYLIGVEPNDELLAQVDAELMNDDNT
ncbi:protein ALP1-like, partial [Capsicum annuum]|uniref:protein ALP1-like n=1 Tax=Capsicum annuum TaxID=4072 RepID=UPI001FB18735